MCIFRKLFRGCWCVGRAAIPGLTRALWSPVQAGTSPWTSFLELPLCFWQMFFSFLWNPLFSKCLNTAWSSVSCLRDFLTTQPASRLPSYESSSQRCLLVPTPCAVKTLCRSRLLDQSLSSLRGGASCLISLAFLAVSTVLYAVLDFVNIIKFFNIEI